jgi:hypothetical protein
MTASRKMTLDEFRATGRYVPDLREVPHSGIESDAPAPGRVYGRSGIFYIEDARGPGNQTEWCCTIGNDSRLGTLAAMEEFLWDFAKDEGGDEVEVPLSADTEGSLCDELKAFCADNKLPHLSADDLLADLLGRSEPPPLWQLSYLRDFMVRWDMTVEARYTAKQA